MIVSDHALKTPINFFDTEHPVTKVAVLNGPRRTPKTHDVVVTNARQSGDPGGLDKGGFLLVNHKTQVRNFRDPDQIRNVYDAEVTSLIKEMTGADLVISFHGQIRDNTADVDPGVVRRPARSAHVDYVEDTFRKHAESVLQGIGENPDEWLKARFSAFNLWRGLAPVEELPLAVCDARTVSPGDLHVVEVEERPGSNDGFRGLLLAHNPAQRWYYYPHMQPHEVLIFKQCDTDPRAPQKCPHTAIEVPDQAAANRPRASFDIRVMAFFKGRN